MKIYHSITELVGRTPLLELEKFEQKYNFKGKLLAKLEYFNPAGSVNDRDSRRGGSAEKRSGNY